MLNSSDATLITHQESTNLDGANISIAGIILSNRCAEHYWLRLLYFLVPFISSGVSGVAIAKRGITKDQATGTGIALRPIRRIIEWEQSGPDKAKEVVRFAEVCITHHRSRMGILRRLDARITGVLQRVAALVSSRRGPFIREDVCDGTVD